jgi:trimeric autotransporter adhesin
MVTKVRSDNFDSDLSMSIDTITMASGSITGCNSISGLESLTSNGSCTVTGTYILGANSTFQATYADLAEKYLSDDFYEPGTVVVFGGRKEITISTEAGCRNIAGVISSYPAYILNADCQGPEVALLGRVPCRVVGTIKKGDMMVASSIPGVATSSNDPKIGSVIGKALADYDSENVGLIEVVVGRI